MDNGKSTGVVANASLWLYISLFSANNNKEETKMKLESEPMKPPLVKFSSMDNSICQFLQSSKSHREWLDGNYVSALN